MPASAEQQQHAVERAAKIFALVKQAAERNQPCPTNAILAARFGCGTARIVSAFDFLEANGMVEVERGQSERVVTICASGKRTSGDAGAPHHTRRAA